MCSLYLFLLLLVTLTQCENFEKSFDERLVEKSFDKRLLEEESFDERQTNCRVLTGTDFTDLGNGSVIFQGQTLPIIGNTSNGDPIVCPPTLQTFFNPTTIFKLPALIFLPLAIIVNILTIVCYEVLKCSAKKSFTLFDSTIINHVITLTFSVFLLLSEGAVFPSVPNLLYCEHIAFFLHFFILAQFFAFACAGIELARVSIQKRLTRRKERLLLVIYLAVTWIVPILLVAICLAINFSLRGSKVLYGITANKLLKCWINQFEFILGFFAVPMFLVLFFVPITIGIQVLGTFLRFQARRRRRRAKKQRRNKNQNVDEIRKNSLSGNSIFDFFAAINAKNERRRRRRQAPLVEITVSQKQQIISVIGYIVVYLCLVLSTVFILVNIFSPIEAISIRGVHTLILFQVVICLTMLVITLANNNVRKSIKNLFRSEGRHRNNRRNESSSSSSRSDSSSEDSSDSESSSDSEDRNKRRRRRRRRGNEVFPESEDVQREERSTKRDKGRKQREAFTDEDDKRRKRRGNKVTSDDQREEESRKRDKNRKKREDFTDDDENDNRRKKRTDNVSSDTDDDQREKNRKRDKGRKLRETFTDEDDNESKRNQQRGLKSEEDKLESNTNQPRATTQVITAEIEPIPQQQQLNNPGQFSYTLPNAVFPPSFQLQTIPSLNQGNISSFPTINLPNLTNYLPPIQGVPLAANTQRSTSIQGVPPVVAIETQRPTSTQGVPPVVAIETQRPTSTQGVPPVVAIETQRPTSTQGVPPKPLVAIETQRPTSTQGVPPVVAIETQGPSRVPTPATSTQIPTSQLQQSAQTISTSQEVALPSLLPTLLQSTTLPQNPLGISASTLNDIVHSSGIVPSQGGKPITIEDKNEEESLKSHSSPSLN